MKRRLFNLLAGLSLLLCVAMATMWARSYSGEESIRLSKHHSYTAVIYAGQLRLSVETDSIMRSGVEGEQIDLSPNWAWQYDRSQQGGGTTEQTNRIGIGHFENTGGQGLTTLEQHFWRQRGIVLPLPLLSLVGVIVPTWWLVLRLRAIRRYHRMRDNLCPICGYDLRVTPDRCPECGTVPKTPTSS